MQIRLPLLEFLMTNPANNPIDALASDLINGKVQQLIKEPEFTASDREDLEQELIIAVLQCLPKFDPEKAKRSTFIVNVINLNMVMLIGQKRVICWL